jgi:hypothetical protein
MTKKTLLIFSFVLLSVLALNTKSFSQTLEFCEGVSDNGTAITPASTFYIPHGGGYFYFLVHLPYELQCKEVYYDIYKIDDYGNATFNTTINQTDMGKDWVWFWKKVTFYDPGYYRIDVVDCYDLVIASDYLTVRYK